MATQTTPTATVNVDDARLLKPEAAAEFLAVSVQTLARWRCERIGPVYIRLNNGGKSSIRYARPALIEYAAVHAVHPKLEPTAATAE